MPSVAAVKAVLSFLPSDDVVRTAFISEEWWEVASTAEVWAQRVQSRRVYSSLMRLSPLLWDRICRISHSPLADELLRELSRMRSPTRSTNIAVILSGLGTVPADLHEEHYIFQRYIPFLLWLLLFTDLSKEELESVDHDVTITFADVTYALLLRPEFGIPPVAGYCEALLAVANHHIAIDDAKALRALSKALSVAAKWGHTSPLSFARMLHRMLHTCLRLEAWHQIGDGRGRVDDIVRSASSLCTTLGYPPPRVYPKSYF